MQFKMNMEVALKRQCLGQVVVLVSLDTEQLQTLTSKLVIRAKAQYPDKRVLYLDGFWSTLGSSQQPQNLDSEIRNWKTFIDDFRATHDLLIVSGNWLKHLAFKLCLEKNSSLPLLQVQEALLNYPTYFIAPQNMDEMTQFQKDNFSAICEFAINGKNWGLVPMKNSIHFENFYLQFESYLKSGPDYL